MSTNPFHPIENPYESGKAFSDLPPLPFGHPYLPHAFLPPVFIPTAERPPNFAGFLGTGVLPPQPLHFCPHQIYPVNRGICSNCRNTLNNLQLLERIVLLQKEVKEKEEEISAIKDFVIPKDNRVGKDSNKPVSEKVE